ncbi:MAG: OmpA family protein [Duncaniella sp.]|nr:OmpA family protein [Duncaniella sp.]
MKENKLFLSAYHALCAAITTGAQDAPEETEYVFQPHWYVQGQVGMQETLGETSFCKLGSFNAQIGAGYRFNPVLGARLILNSWTSKGSIDVNGKHDWKWKYIAPTVNVTADLVNLFGGFNPERPVNAGVFAGIGANIAYSNDEANAVNNALIKQVYTDNNQPAQNVLRNIWSGTKARFVGQFGVYADYNVTSNVKIGLELQANVLPDGYNSKKAGNADWYFNGLVGVKYAFGTTFTKQKKAKCCNVVPETQIVEKIVEVPVEKIVVKEVIKEVVQPLTRDVFFKISTFSITKDEMYKVAEVARYLKNNPSTKVTVTGYADKGTGTMKINLRLSAQRAEVVAKALQDQYGIPADRIIVKSMGEVEDQPYDTPAHNRVAICVVE